jgi:hypothetical protein
MCWVLAFAEYSRFLKCLPAVAPLAQVTYGTLATSNYNQYLQILQTRQNVLCCPTRSVWFAHLYAKVRGYRRFCSGRMLLIRATAVTNR